MTVKIVKLTNHLAMEQAPPLETARARRPASPCRRRSLSCLTGPSATAAVWSRLPVARVLSWGPNATAVSGHRARCGETAASPGSASRPRVTGQPDCRKTAGELPGQAPPQRAGLAAVAPGRISAGPRPLSGTRVRPVRLSTPG